MFMETALTQKKLREIFHEETCSSPACQELGDETSSCYGTANRSAVLTLGKLMPTLSREMFPLVRADERSQVAHRIRAELVCCDLYEQINGVDLDPLGITMRQCSTMTPERMAERMGLTWHDICHWGGYAAAIAEQGSDRTYFCPTSGTDESGSHGGFDTCCDRPDLHRPAVGD